jgi:putative PIN family toxin of toxin-antitoxin system
MRIVLDTNVLVSAMGWDGNERAVLLEAMSKENELLLSDFIVSEFIDVTSRSKFASLSVEKLASFLEIILETAEMVEPSIRINVVKEDEADNRILECAAGGKADYLVTGDRHLLELKTYRKNQIVSAVEMLRIIRKNQA